MRTILPKISAYLSFYARESRDPSRLCELRRTRALVHGCNPYQPVPFPGFQDVRFERSTKARFSSIIQSIDFTPGSLLDVGCNVGYFCFQFCQCFEGLIALGVDSNADAIAAARSVAGLYRLDRVKFRKYEFGSGGDQNLPRSEVVCCLSLLHHIFGLRGREAGLDAVRRLRQLTSRVLFFEVGSFLETNEAWAQGLQASLPGGEEEVCGLMEAVGFAKPIAIGEERSHLAPVTRRIFSART